MNNSIFGIQGRAYKVLDFDKKKIVIILITSKHFGIDII